LPSPHSSKPLAADAAAQAPLRTRPAPGERRQQILQAMAVLLQDGATERITTSALAAHLEVREAALYRHFASKAQMYEGLMDFIEQAVFRLVHQVQEREPDGRQQVRAVVTLVLQFAEKNPGLARVMAGDALVLEHQRLQVRMNQMFDKIESVLRQSLREPQPGQLTDTTACPDPKSVASLLGAFVLGRIQRYARSAYRDKPTQGLADCLKLVV
jgi:TetR/AcrR family transcriptional regulator